MKKTRKTGRMVGARGKGKGVNMEHGGEMEGKVRNYRDRHLTQLKGGGKKT